VSLRHAGALIRGTKTLLDAIEEAVGTRGGAELWGREVLAAASRESLGREYNSEARETTLFVNARARPDRELRALASRASSFVAVVGGELVAARLPGRAMSPGVVHKKDFERVSKKVERLDAPQESLFRGYWDLVDSNGLAVAEQAGHFTDSLALPDAVDVKGPPSNLRIEGTAEVERYVAFDVRPGPVVVEKGAVIESFSRIAGPSYIGANTKVHSALIEGGTSIFEGCNIGGHVESSVVMAHSNKAHEGYVGHAYVGEWANLGAGSIFSNLKNTYGNVRVELGTGKKDSGMLKLGPAVGDMCKISIGALIYAGKMIGTGSHVSGLASHGVPSFTHFDGFTGKMLELRIDSVLETQRRMMERRGMTPTRAQEELIRRVFTATAQERRRARVKAGRIG
jgi:UDP-N-acetylglucosamine diphosphorylase/glucosamine-1-phosphate N-acetyltransferase